jgi:hypothetical protein
LRIGHSRSNVYDNLSDSDFSLFSHEPFPDER